MEEQQLSSSSQEKHAELHRELDRELRQFTGLSASIFRAAAARVDLTVTDMQVLDILESAGPTTAGHARYLLSDRIKKSNLSFLILLLQEETS